jgi:DNA-binding MarR family transcriptional regulator
MLNARNAVGDQRVRPSDIATALGVHRSAVTHQIQGLEQVGQVKLTVDPRIAVPGSPRSPTTGGRRPL